MRKYWWVNHKQTFDQEINGGYLWAPKVQRNGAISQFYENLRLASPGDFVLSFANGKIEHVGEVLNFAMSTPKPDTFGAAGDAWADDGWRLPVSWRRLPAPVRPKSFIGVLGPLLPTRYSPIQAHSGNGNQAAYLAEIGLPVFQMMLSQAGTDLDLLMATPALSQVCSDIGEEMDEVIERQVIISKSLAETDKVQIIKARRGQGIFRSNVQKAEKCCRVTGISAAYLLVASHIKPWRSCADSFERLDGNNGLFLTPHVDLLFDRGLLTFGDDGGLLVSSRIDPADLTLLGIPPVIFAADPFCPTKQTYLGYHRANVFLV